MPDTLRAAALCCTTHTAFDRAHRWASNQGRSAWLIPAGDWQQLATLLRDQPDVVVLTDRPEDPRLAAWSPIDVASLPEAADWPTAAPQPLALLFTSGSTGAPSAQAKTLERLRTELAAVIEVLGPSLNGARFVTTLPLEHTFGYSFAYWLPRLAGAECVPERVVTPARLRRLGQDSDRPLWLITTPVHMKSCVELGLRVANVAGVVSATSPLSSELARAAAHCFGVPITECYGSTETGSIAFRQRHVDEQVMPPWQPLPGGCVLPQGEGHAFVAPHLPGPVPLADLLEPCGDGFHIIGRQGDLLKVFGKRHSLAALNQKLSALPMVADAAYFMPEPGERAEADRPAAVVVLRPGHAPQEVLDALRGTVDDVFLPRPLIVADSLPRNAAGKLRRADLLALLQQGQSSEPAAAVADIH
ncbi:acyl-CoA synthetase [Ideonella sp. 4Y11]|uniref:Acyl-CoA synthetase n=1 Tax=Ideonella aquatica TaxID=2824119 RepID=A0A940YGX2_9BURK|nr:AMP-binding protein [Ideonella aquatica]MBQ0957951.1 acyl-CoA synthetase [Ideonella aquatica]